MNTEALLRLADKLEGKGPYEEDGPIPDENFDLEDWYKYMNVRPRSCGFVACACGWAATDPWFIERGFTIGYTAKGLPRITWSAVWRTFDMTMENSQYLFARDRYLETDEYGHFIDRKVPASEVAQRIRKFVGEHI